MLRERKPESGIEPLSDEYESSALPLCYSGVAERTGFEPVSRVSDNRVSNPALLPFSHRSTEATVWIEHTNHAFAVRCLTAWLHRQSTREWTRTTIFPITVNGLGNRAGTRVGYSGVDSNHQIATL